MIHSFETASFFKAMNTTLQCSPYTLELNTPFTISHGTRSTQDIVLVKISRSGLQGLGEASAISYYNRTTQDFIKKVEEHKKEIENLPRIHPFEFFKQLDGWYQEDSFVKAALDMAYWDLYAQEEEQTIHHLLNLPLPSGRITNFTLGIDSPQGWNQSMLAFNWPIYKLKANATTKLEGLNVPLKSNIRIDANESWSVELLSNLHTILNQLPIDLIEQPLPRNQLSEMKSLRKNLPWQVPFIADESFQDMDHLEECIESFDGINIKLMKCGGITPALEIAKKAKELGTKVMLGCMTSSSISIAATAQIMHYADFLDLDAPLLVSNDPIKGLHLSEGQITLKGKTGLGIQMK